MQLHPNIFWNRYGEWFSLTNVTPTSPDTCLTTFDIFFKPKTLQDAAFVAKCLAAEDQLQKEDIELCMRVGACLRVCAYACVVPAYAATPAQSRTCATRCTMRAATRPSRRPCGYSTRRARLLRVQHATAADACRVRTPQLLHRDIFGTAPGLKHPLISSNRNFMTKTE